MVRRRGQQFEPFRLRQLTGPRLCLQQAQPADAEGVFGYASRPEASRYLAWRPHRDVAETELFLQGSADAWQAGGRLPWVIRDGGRLVGMIEAKLSGRNAGIGYVIAPDAWGRGYASEAVELVSEALFELSPVRAIWALCVVQNLASARVLEKNGYRCEVLLPGYLHCPNLGEGKQDVWRYVRYGDATKNRVKPV